MTNFWPEKLTGDTAFNRRQYLMELYELEIRPNGYRGPKRNFCTVCQAFLDTYRDGYGIRLLDTQQQRLCRGGVREHTPAWGEM
ncbi:hypothetical protein ACIBHY_17235 [Nonomuraea sp. NPDC050547]|uniref:hypothetical protein n=1 Tax=Nonomuraea sp. NPDC050547 TaxID=3364368 RepID=UPI0037AE0174